jgi:hypothetical protein
MYLPLQLSSERGLGRGQRSSTDACLVMSTLAELNTPPTGHLRSPDVFDINRKHFGLNWKLALEARGFLVADQAR